MKLLIPLSGLMRAATTTVVGTAAWNLAMLIYVHRRLDINRTAFTLD